MITVNSGAVNGNISAAGRTEAYVPAEKADSPDYPPLQLRAATVYHCCRTDIFPHNCRNRLTRLHSPCSL